MRTIGPGRSSKKTSKSGRASTGQRHPSSQPDAVGVATRLAARRLREAGIRLEPLLRNAGLSIGQIDEQDTPIRVASQIKFLELAAEALQDQLLGFRLARDGDLRLMGLLYYTAASSETLGDALARAQRYSSIVNAGIVLRCFRSGAFTIGLRYVGVSRHSDRKHNMEFLVTVLIRVCRVLTDRRLSPTTVRFIHRDLDKSSEMEKFFGCAIEFGAETDEIVFQDTVAGLHLIGADPYLSKILIENCDQGPGPSPSQCQLATSYNRERNYLALAPRKGAPCRRCQGAGHEQPHASSKNGRGRTKLQEDCQSTPLRSRHTLFE